LNVVVFSFNLIIVEIVKKSEELKEEENSPKRAVQGLSNGCKENYTLNHNPHDV
jgi:hypothetical protein